MSKKTYRGERFNAGDLTVVTVNGRPLEHIVRHSPDGFEWGYGGSGPADLALSIVADHLGYVPHPMVYQGVKNHHVATWGHRWELTDSALEATLERLRETLRSSCLRCLDSGMVELTKYCDCPAGNSAA